MKKFSLLIASLLLFSGILFFTTKENPTNHPVPTEIAGEEDADNQIKREKWFEMMHKTAPGVNWQALEYATAKRRADQRAALRNAVSTRTGSTEIAGGKLVGTWNERGSQNQAGSVFETEFDAEREEIWVLSAGGSIFKGPLSGNAWEVVNQDLRFDNGLLKFVKTDIGRRLLALTNNTPHYSDDDGKTWTAAAGIPVGDSYMNTSNCIVLNDSLSTIYVISKPDYWTNAKLYKSTDKGENFIEIHQLGSYDLEEFKLVKPHNSNRVFLIEKISVRTRLSEVNVDTDEIEVLREGFEISFRSARANLAATAIGDSIKFVVYAGNNDNIRAHQSLDMGETWEELGLIEEKPWAVGLFISKTNPDLMIAGGLNCFVSKNGGKNWFKKNEWWAYYDDVDGALHADMMVFDEFTTTAGQHFQLISNHGGLSVSYDEMIKVKNLSLTSLNVSQYYSVRTDPTDPYYIYAGSQDQGFQRANTALSENLADFDQTISGDYGHIVFAKGGAQMWTVYPGGAVTNFTNPKLSDSRTGWTVESDDESVWIPPIMASPDDSENAVFLAGGNANGGAGSHIIKLTNRFNDITPDQLPFDFKDESAGGEVSALGLAKSETNQWYAATTNGRFFYSTDSGQNWEQSINFIPDGHYLYGQAIEVSKKDSKTVYLGGSGYSGPACFVSTDGGENFQPLNDSLPATLIFGLALNDDENMLFAATEAGPYVYIFEDNQWYDLSGLDAPAQTYWSVEFVPFSNTARFGTYGRGIWDFNIESFTNSRETAAIDNDFNLKVYPNPATGGKIYLEIEDFEFKKAELQLTDISGKMIREFDFDKSLKTQTLDVSGLDGVYFLSLKTEERMISKKVILK